MILRIGAVLKELGLLTEEETVKQFAKTNKIFIEQMRYLEMVGCLMEQCHSRKCIFCLW